MKSTQHLLLAFALGLGGCASLVGGRQTPFTIYAPAYAPSASTQGGDAVDWQLRIEAPQSSSVIDSTRMLAMPRPGVLEVFSGVRWRDPAPSMLRDLVLHGFEASGRIVGVDAGTAGVRADFGLALELRSFHADYTSTAPRAVVEIQAQLIHYASARIIAAKLITSQAPLEGNSAAAAFAGFQVALGAAVDLLVDWTLGQGQRFRVEKPAS